MNPKEQARELSRQGYSIREIAERIETSKSTVARWLQESAPNQPISSQPDPSIELELKRMQLNHELELRKLAQQEKEQEYRRRDMERQYAMKQEQEEVVDIELRKILLPIYKWATNQIQLVKEYSMEGIPCSEDSLTDMSYLLDQFHETLSDYVHIRKLDEWDDVLDTLKSIRSKVDSWFIQYLKYEDEAREEFEYQKRRAARLNKNTFDRGNHSSSQNKNKVEPQADEEEFEFNVQIYCEWGKCRSDLLYLAERVR